MGFQGNLCCCLPTPFWIILFLPHLILLFNFLDMKAVKELYEIRQEEKIGDQDILYFAFISGFNNPSVGDEILPEYNEMVVTPSQGVKMC